MSRNGTTLIDIATVAQWGPARHVNTRLGPRIVRKAPVPDDFRSLWHENKDALRAAGITWDVDRSGPQPSAPEFYLELHFLSADFPA